jgi:hypothetical protein
MRRVELDPASPVEHDDNFNYVSFTIWKDKKSFNAWRRGDAFKEAHGGTSIGAFLGAMVSSLMVLSGPPRPAFYDGLLLQTSGKPALVPETVTSWGVTLWTLCLTSSIMVTFAFRVSFRFVS